MSNASVELEREGKIRGGQGVRKKTRSGVANECEREEDGGKCGADGNKKR
jgi:hypothetical protein